MSWVEIGNILFSDYSHHDWMKGIRLGYLISFSQDDGIVIRDSQNLKVVFHEDTYSGKKLNYYLFDDELFYSVDRMVYRHNFETNEPVLVCSTEEEYIWMSSKYFAIGATFKRRPRVNRNEIIQLSNCNTIYKWTDSRGLIHIDSDGHSIFKNDFDSVLRAIDLKESKDLWELQLKGFSAPRFYQNVSEDLFLVMQSFDTEHPVDKRYELWGIDKIAGDVVYKSKVDHFDRFVYSPEKQKLFGISGQEYLNVNPFTGEIERRREIEELGEHWATLGRQSISGNDIFFIISGNPNVGRFNIISETVEEFIEISVDETKVDMRQPLNTPFYHRGILYVRDNSGIMHIFQRESNHPT